MLVIGDHGEALSGGLGERLAGAVVRGADRGMVLHGMPDPASRIGRA
jgi:hypothetical protein